MAQRILLIDDDRNITDGMEHIIQETAPDQYEISKAYDGFQAIKALEKKYYHLIISDIKMPFLDGLQLLELIQKNEIPSQVVMISGYDDYAYIRKAMKTGAYDYLLKPVTIHVVKDLLSSIGSQLVDSDKVLPETNIDIHSMEATKQTYFDTSVEHSLNLEELKGRLSQLKTLVLECKEEEMKEAVREIFSGLSEEIVSETQWKRMLSDCVYEMMQQNENLIRIIARYKLSDNDLVAQIKNQSTASQLMQRMISILSCYIKDMELKKKANDEKIVNQAKAYIDKHFMEEISLADIAEQFHLHPNYFSTVFKKKTGGTIRDYILTVRINKAKEMMDHTELKLLDIALAVGYEDPAHFNRAFKNLTGISPSQYRKQK